VGSIVSAVHNGNVCQTYGKGVELSTFGPSSRLVLHGTQLGAHTYVAKHRLLSKLP